EWGYHRVPLVQDPGDLSLRGGILDVFPVGYGEPARLEFLGDTIESLRAFDPTSQRSLGPVEELLLLPVAEFGRARLGADTARAGGVAGGPGRRHAPPAGRRDAPPARPRRAADRRARRGAAAPAVAPPAAAGPARRGRSAAGGRGGAVAAQVAGWQRQGARLV